MNFTIYSHRSTPMGKVTRELSFHAGGTSSELLRAEGVAPLALPVEGAT